ncbi:MAG: hypothetical protein OXH12_01945 [Chloroflexi bacterium]|nr:hypothetical protein [Chloroflexota bacterium]
MALTFNSREAVQKLLGRGLPEPAADGIVEVVEDATSEVVTRDILHAELYRALWVFGTGMVATVGVIVGAIVGVATALD